MWRRIIGLFAKGKTLYYPGCLTQHMLPDIKRNYRTLLDMVGVEYITLDKFDCCGMPVRNAGYEDEFKELIERNREFFAANDIRRIITNCPACFTNLKAHHSENGITVEHISSVLARNIDKLETRYAKQVEGNKVTYHDPCYLGRKGGVYNEPRQLIRAFGLELNEFPENRNMSMCCGAGGGMRNNNPQMADSAAKRKLAMSGTKTIVTPCPMCYLHLKENAHGMGIEVLELGEMMVGDKMHRPDGIGQAKADEPYAGLSLSKVNDDADSTVSDNDAEKVAIGAKDTDAENRMEGKKERRKELYDC